MVCVGVGGNGFKFLANRFDHIAWKFRQRFRGFFLEDDFVHGDDISTLLTFFQGSVSGKPSTPSPASFAFASLDLREVGLADSCRVGELLLGERFHPRTLRQGFDKLNLPAQGKFFTNTCTAPNAVRCKCKRIPTRADLFIRDPIRGLTIPIIPLPSRSPLPTSPSTPSPARTGCQRFLCVCPSRSARDRAC